ncbi:hypothetical protein L228DRAFT_244949 [Xylona heveae TC161]|uniref:DUF4484 domain-containing protein n=1 Tax=Xylona heveae (strain CBS 132557 / TC161) TaxID=1328760 RepID=A0A165HXS8_XYLHT|nr:hypothetical protein L228DRAFT_244949 [Xylona heveae TC161]KZF24075.1 hypothetical protein L228DRAFT_244949 [Xylona heveae TC161]
MTAREDARSLGAGRANPEEQELPPVAAVFLIHFDIKAGYTVGWKRCLPEVDLEGFVEFKSLPSGLHKVHEDLVYFVHDQYAGISAYVNEPAAASERNARMLAVGVLVPLSSGRLGRSWHHAKAIKGLARRLVGNIQDTQPLEEFWEAHRLSQEELSSSGSSASGSPSDMHFKPARRLSNDGEGRNASVSSVTVSIPPVPILSDFHPALSLSKYLDVFGPLVFPLYRAALLRKRILLVGQAPVELACNFVYDISILSNVPLTAANLLPSDAAPSRLRPLFTIGVHDIPYLERCAQTSDATSRSQASAEDGLSDEQGQGWIACTTDDVLAMKRNLYDIIVWLPRSHPEDAKERVWPKLETSQGKEIKATQRDLRRYRALRTGLRRFQVNPLPRYHDDEIEDDDEETALLASDDDEDSETNDVAAAEEQAAEPLSWSALAYSGFMWWASAGERRSDLDAEETHDAALLDDLDELKMSPSGLRRRQSSGSQASHRISQRPVETVLVAYFHRLTTLIIATLADIVDTEASHDEEADMNKPVFISSDDMMRMGLDIWSDGDKKFVGDILKIYFDHNATVQGASIECCGIRIC